jgi:hypothetical protein
MVEGKLAADAAKTIMFERLQPIDLARRDRWFPVSAFAR